MVWRRLKGKELITLTIQLCVQKLLLMSDTSLVSATIFHDCFGDKKTPRSLSCWTIQELWCMSANLWKAKAGKSWVWASLGYLLRPCYVASSWQSGLHVVLCKRIRTLGSQLSPCIWAQQIAQGGVNNTKLRQGLTTLNFWGCRQEFTMGFTYISKNSLWDNRNTNSWWLIKCLKPQVHI